MKKFAFIACLMVIVGQVRGQQVPLYSNYFFTPYIYNPAMSGTSGVTEATILHRRQWSGIQGSPETSALALNGSLNDQKVGYSLYGFADKTDILSRMGFYGNYAYHLRLSESSTLSFGLGAGYINQAIDPSAIRAQDAGDIFTVASPNRGSFDINAGLSLQIADLRIGAAAPQLLSQNIEYTDNASSEVNYNLIRHYVFNAMYDFKFNGDKQILSPTVMVRAAEMDVPIQIDAGLLFNLVEYGYIGAMFRSDYAVTGNLGVNLTDQLTVGYAYDFSLNEYGSNFGTSHEFMLTYRFGSNKANDRLENELKRLKLQQRRQRDETEEIVDEKLEKFKDSYKQEIEDEIEAQKEKIQKDLDRQAAQSSGNNRNTAGGNNDRANNRNRDQGQNQSLRDRVNNDQDSWNNPPPNNNNTGGYDASNQANNVTPGSPGYYVTAGVFSSQANAQQLVNRLGNQGFNARFFQDQRNNFYYVYLLKFNSYQEADQARSSKMNGSYSGDLWIKIIE